MLISSGCPFLRRQDELLTRVAQEGDRRLRRPNARQAQILLIRPGANERPLDASSLTLVGADIGACTHGTASAVEGGPQSARRIPGVHGRACRLDAENPRGDVDEKRIRGLVRPETA